MPKQRNTFQLGLMVIVVAALLLVAVIFIGGRSLAPTVPIRVLVRHDLRIPQLKTGAPIICGPQQVGSVTSVTSIETALPDRPNVSDFLFFEVLARVYRSIDLRSDCRIAVEGQILGNQGQLVIENRGTDPRRASLDTPIFAKAIGFASDLAMITQQFDEMNPASLLSQIKRQLDAESPRSIVAKVHKIIDDLKAMTLSLRNTVDPDRDDAVMAKVHSILDHLNAITRAIGQQLETGDEQMLMTKLHRNLDLLNRGLADVVDTIEENRADLRATVRSTSQVAARLDETVLPAVEQELTRADAASLLAKAHGVFEDLNTALANFNAVSDRARRVAVLAEDPVLTLVRNAKEASDHLKAAAKDLRRHPWKLIHQPDDTELKQALIFDAVREFADAAGSLDDAVGRLKALHEAGGEDLSGDDPTLRAFREELDAATERFSAAEKALWKQLDID